MRKIIEKANKKATRIYKLYEFLRKKYGQPQEQWVLWCKRPKTIREKERVVIESILTQRTNWRNVERAMGNLKRARMDSLLEIAAAGDAQPRNVFLKKKITNKKMVRNRLVSLIKPSGFYKQKSKYLIGLAEFIVKNGGIAEISKIPIRDLRLALVNLKGVGSETADSILLYALEKPVFVIDGYTKKFLANRLRPMTGEMKYENLQQLFEKNLPRDWRLYQDFHALIVIHGKNSANRR